MAVLRQAARDGRCDFVSTLLLSDVEITMLEDVLRLNAQSHYSNCLMQIVQKLLSTKNQTAEVGRLININNSSDVLEAVAKAVPGAFLAAAGEKAFTRAVAGNRCYLIGPLVAAGSDPGQEDAREALALAAGGASVGCARALRAAGVPPLDAPLYSAMLRNASTTCGAQLLAALLAAGVDPTLPDADGRSALQLAARAGPSPCVWALKPHFAHRLDLVLRALNETDNAAVARALAAGERQLIGGSEGANFLKEAVRDGRCAVAGAVLSLRTQRQYDAAVVLTQPEADVKCVDSILNVVQGTDEQNKVVSLIKYWTRRADILEKVAATFPDDFLGEPGMLAEDVKSGRCYMIRAYFVAGLSPGDLDAHRALEAAAENDDEECVKALRQEGVAPLADERSKSALLSAGLHGKRQALKALLAAGVFVDAADGEGHTALTLAAWSGHADIVVDLLNAGADKDRPQLDGSTALMLASREGHLDVVLKLLHVHAQVDAKSEKQSTALMLASMQGHVEIVRTLLNARAKVDEGNIAGDTPLILASWKGRTEVVRELLEANANVDIRNERNDTALIVASHFGYTNIVSLLLKANATVNVSNRSGGTALIQSSGVGHLEVVKLLLNARADVNVKTNTGSTALMSACSGGHLEIVNLLLEHNADITVQDNLGKTAIDVASDGEHTEIVKVLKNALGSD